MQQGMKSVMNYAAMSIERLTDNVPFRMAILGPSPPYEYPINELLYVGERSVHEGLVVEQMTEVVEVVRYFKIIRFHSASQEEANAVAVILRPEWSQRMRQEVVRQPWRERLEPQP